MTDEQGRGPAMSDHAKLMARLEDIAALHRSRGAHRDCQVHYDFEPDCWFCQVTVIEDALAALRAAPAPAAGGLSAALSMEAATALEPPKDCPCPSYACYSNHRFGGYRCRLDKELAEREAASGDADCTTGPPEAASEPDDDAELAAWRRWQAQGKPDVAAAVRQAQREVLEQVQAKIAAIPDEFRGADGEPSGFMVEDIIQAHLEALRGGDHA